MVGASRVTWTPSPGWAARTARVTAAARAWTSERVGGHVAQCVFCLLELR